MVSPRCAYDCPRVRFTESPSSVSRERIDITMNTNSTRYERYERSSTPVDTATMKRTSHRTAKRQGFKALRPQRLAGGRLHRDRSKDLGNHRGRCEVLEPRVRLKDEPMRERRCRERLYVVRRDVVTPAHRCVCLGCPRQRERSPRGSAEVHVGVRSRRRDHVDDVLLYRLGEVYLARGRLGSQQLL